MFEVRFYIITHNVQGFLLCGYSVIRQPEQLLSKVIKLMLYSVARLYSSSLNYR